MPIDTDTRPLPVESPPPSGPQDGNLALPADRPPHRRSRRRGWPAAQRLGRACAAHPIRSVVGVVVLVVLVAAATSYTAKLREPGSDTFTERSAEWLRDNGFGWLVNWGEQQQYNLSPPKEGGDPRAIDQVPAERSASGATGRGPDHLTPPASLVSPAPSPVAGEGQWTPIASVGGAPAVYSTQIRPDAVHTSYLDVVGWMDPKLVRFELHPGVEVPGGGGWSTPPLVPTGEAASLLAAFNGGFRMQDAGGGFYADGRGASTLRTGDATFVVRADGTATVGQWGRDVTMDNTVVAARQNLALIVDGGRPAADLDENPGDKWGATVGNKVFVWRSGVGVTVDGAIVYVGGPSLSARSLAETLVRAGATRAMELDINHDWVSFNSYRTDNGATTGSRLLPEMFHGGDRYLSTDSRDFVAVLARTDQVGSATSPATSTAPPPAPPATAATVKPTPAAKAPQTHRRGRA